DACMPDGLVTGADEPLAGDDRNTATFRGDRHGVGQFAVDTLPVDAALARYHEVDTDEPLVESHRVEDERRARHEPRIEERDEPRAETTGRAGAGHAAHVATHECLDHVHVARVRGLVLALDLGMRALLRI